MADESSIILTTVEVDTKSGVANLKSFEKQVETTATSARASLSTMDDGLGPLRDLLNQNRTAAAAFESQMTSMGRGVGAASQVAVTGAAAILPAVAAIGVAASVATGLIYGTVSALGSFAEAAAPITQLSRGFETLTTRVGETGQAFLEVMRPATRGFVSDVELMKATNRALLLDLPVTVQTMAELAGGAVKLGQAMGVDAVRSVDSLIEGIGRQSPRLLDNIGIIVRAQQVYKEYAAELGVSVESLTDQERKLAFTNAALESVRQKTEGMIPVQAAFSDQWRQSTVVIDNARNSLLVYADQALGAAITALGQGVLRAGEFGDASIGAFQSATASAVGFGGTAGLAMRESNQHTGEFLTGVLRLVPGIDSVIQSLGLLGAASKDALGNTLPPNLGQRGAVGPAQDVRIAPRFERADEEIDKASEKLAKARGEADALRLAITRTDDVTLQKLLTKELQGVDNKIRGMLGNVRDLQGQYEQQLVQTMAGAAAKGSEIQGALQQASLAIRYNREIEAARKQNESTTALAQTRDVAIDQSAQRFALDRTRRVFTDDASVAQAHLQNDQLSADQRLSLEQRVASDRFEIAVAEADREGRDTADLFEIYQSVIDEIDRRHRDQRRIQTIDDAQSLRDQLSQIAQTQTEGQLQGLESPQPASPGGFSPGEADLELELIRQRAVVEQAANEEVMAVKLSELEATYQKEQILFAGNLDAQKASLQKFQNDSTLVVMKASQQRIAISKQEAAATGSVQQAAFAATLNQYQMLNQAIGGAVAAAFGHSKKGAYAGAIVNTAGAIMQAMNMPYPASLVFAAIAAATGAIQIAKISSTTLEGGGGGGGGVPSAPSVDYSQAVKTPGEQNVTGTTPVIAGAPTQTAATVPQIAPTAPIVAAPAPAPTPTQPQAPVQAAPQVVVTIPNATQATAQQPSTQTAAPAAGAQTSTVPPPQPSPVIVPSAPTVPPIVAPSQEVAAPRVTVAPPVVPPIAPVTAPAPVVIPAVVSTPAPVFAPQQAITAPTPTVAAGAPVTVPPPIVNQSPTRIIAAAPVTVSQSSPNIIAARPPVVSTPAPTFAPAQAIVAPNPSIAPAAPLQVPAPTLVPAPPVSVPSQTVNQAPARIVPAGPIEVPPPSITQATPRIAAAPPVAVPSPTLIPAPPLAVPPQALARVIAAPPVAIPPPTIAQSAPRLVPAPPVIVSAPQPILAPAQTIAAAIPRIIAGPPVSVPSPTITQSPPRVITSTPITIGAPASATPARPPTVLNETNRTSIQEISRTNERTVEARAPISGAPTQNVAREAGEARGGDVFNITVDPMTLAELLQNPKNARAAFESYQRYGSRT